MILAGIKQVEVDERIELEDKRIIAILDKMAKQRRESIAQFEVAKRQDLVDQEQFELGVIGRYLPAALSEAEIDAEIQAALQESGATTVKDMGKLMGILKPKLQGRADMASVSKKIKAQLNQ